MLTFAVTNALFNRNGFFDIFRDICNNTFAIVNVKMAYAFATIFCNLIVILHLYITRTMKKMHFEFYISMHVILS